MKCVICGGETRVDDTANDSDCILRRRVCRDCGNTMITIEIQSFDKEDAERLSAIRHGKKKKKVRNKP